MNKILHFFLTLALAFLSATALAQSTAYVGLCDGNISDGTTGNVTGINGSDATIDLAIRIPQANLASYIGCRITAIHVGLPNEAAPEAFSVWVRNEKDGANIAEGNGTGALRKGWNEIPLAQSYTITGNEGDLWLGFEYRQLQKLSIISFAGETATDGAWVRKNGKWTDYSAKGWGNLAIEAVVEGNVPSRNIAITKASTRQGLVQIGQPLTVSGTVKNLASTTADKPVITYCLNGTELGTFTIDAKLLYRESADFSIDIPTDIITEEGTITAELRLSWGDGGEDEGPADNIARITSEAVREVYYRKMVVEEATGAWCGFCVRGIVGLREMKALYPNDFIGIAIHNSDSYVVEDYDKWIGMQINGYPACVINRNGQVYDPNFSELNTFFNRMPTVANAGISLKASVAGSKITFDADTRFLSNIDNADYRIIFVLVENKLPISQSNYYSGGTYGPMGGFENMEDHCMVLVDDVARGIYPSVNGFYGALPESIEKQHNYNYRFTADLPTYRNAENVEAVALLFNAITGEIEQATKTATIEGFNDSSSEGIVHIATTTDETPTAFDLAGRKCTPQRGQIFISNGRVHINK